MDFLQYLIALLQAMHDTLLELRELNGRDKFQKRRELVFGPIYKTTLVRSSLQCQTGLCLPACRDCITRDFVFLIKHDLKLRES